MRPEGTLLRPAVGTRVTGTTRRGVCRWLATAGVTIPLAGCVDREPVDLRVTNADDRDHRVRIVVVPNGGRRFTADLRVNAESTFERADVLPPAGKGRPYDTTVTVDGGQTIRSAVGTDGMRAIAIEVRAPDDVRVGVDRP